MTAPTAPRPTSVPDALATPWSGVRLQRPAGPAVDFSHVAAPPAAGSRSTDTPPVSLDTPWQRHAVRCPSVPPVDFSALPAPVLPPRPEPLVVRGAFVPMPRTRVSGLR